MKTSQWYVNIDGDGVEVGQVHIDKLSKNSENAPVFTFSRKMRQESLEQKPSVEVAAQALNDFERVLIGQVLDLVKEVEKKYPERATHWPGGPGLYHVDAKEK